MKKIFSHVGKFTSSSLSYPFVVSCAAENAEKPRAVYADVSQMCKHLEFYQTYIHERRGVNQRSSDIISDIVLIIPRK